MAPPLQAGPAPSVAALHVVGWQHARPSGALHGPVHPALVDGLSVHDDVAIAEGHLVVVLRRVVVQRPVDALGGGVKIKDSPLIPRHGPRGSTYQGGGVRRRGDGPDGGHAGLEHVAVRGGGGGLVVRSRKDRGWTHTHTHTWGSEREETHTCAHTHCERLPGVVLLLRSQRSEVSELMD